MNANELRIGNYVDLYSTTAQVCRHDFNTESPKGLAVDRGEPIPLTEEWFIKLGLKTKCFAYTDSNGTPFFGWAETHQSRLKFYSVNNGVVWICRINDKVDLCEIKHVHQLQNLYFALTGEELTVT